MNCIYLELSIFKSNKNLFTPSSKPGGKSLDVQILPTNTLSVNPLMMKDYHSYFVQLLTKLDHTNSSMKVI